jgi:hypothetical protein
MSNTTYIFRWDRHGRKGQRCVILARGTMNSCFVRFDPRILGARSQDNVRRPAIASAAAFLRGEHAMEFSDLLVPLVLGGVAAILGRLGPR